MSVLLSLYTYVFFLTYWVGYTNVCCLPSPVHVLRSSLIRPWQTTPCLTSPASLTGSSSPSLTPSTTRYVKILSSDLFGHFFLHFACGFHSVWMVCSTKAWKHSSILLSSLTGRRCHLHDLHHRSAHRVRGHRADLQRPAQPKCPRRGQCPDEGLSGCMFRCLSIAATKPTNTFAALLPWDVPVNLQTSPSPPALFRSASSEELSA